MIEQILSAVLHAFGVSLLDQWARREALGMRLADLQDTAAAQRGRTHS